MTTHEIEKASMSSSKEGRAAKQSTKINPKKKGRRTGMIMLRPQLKEQRKTNCLN